MIIMLGGAIDYWWNENWETPAHIDYMEWRDEVRQSLVDAGHLCYLPWGGFKGAWDEKAQAVNDKAVEICDVFIDLTPDGIPAPGTDAERALAEMLDKKILFVPPGDWTNLSGLLAISEDPYADVDLRTHDGNQCQHPLNARALKRLYTSDGETIETVCKNCGKVLDK